MKKFNCLLAAALAVMIGVLSVSCENSREESSSEPSSQASSSASSEPSSEVSAESASSQESSQASQAPEQADFSRTKGLWVLWGDFDTASIDMDGEGNFTSLYASGSTECTGTLKYAENDNSLIEMYDGEGKLFNSFRFDSDSQIVMEDTQWPYLLQIPDPDLPVLIWPTRFTGMTPGKSMPNYRGGYYGSDITQDGLTTVVNCAFLTEDAPQSLEEYAEICTNTVCMNPILDLFMVQNEELSRNFGYTVWDLSWTVDGFDDISVCEGIFFMTEDYTYLFFFESNKTNAEEMSETWIDLFSTLIFE